MQRVLQKALKKTTTYTTMNSIFVTVTANGERLVKSKEVSILPGQNKADVARDTALIVSAGEPPQSVRYGFSDKRTVLPAILAKL